MKSLATVNKTIRCELFDEQNNPNLNGKVYSSEELAAEIRRVVSHADIKNTGSFFTGDSIAQLGIEKIQYSIDENSIVFDPTCGVGNLLIAASEKLPVFASLDRTIGYWGKILHGLDLHEEFVECTKLRLIQCAILRGASTSSLVLPKLEELLPNIQVGNVFSKLSLLRKATHLLLNPPYTLRALPNNRNWGGGKINMAAVFVEDVFNSCAKGTKFIGILPEVLRSGSRYMKWREIIIEGNGARADIIGRFDESTDVDVFLLYGEIGRRKTDVCVLKHRVTNSLGDFFDVSVGPLVAYRDKKEGPRVPYIHARSLEKWQAAEPSEFRKTRSRLIKPPFVVINRTSSPSDQYRAKASIVKGKFEVAVENHLLIAKPRKGGLASCRKLVRVLKSEATNDFFNSRIRCRHLTVDSVKEVPWREEK